VQETISETRRGNILGIKEAFDKIKINMKIEFYYRAYQCQLSQVGRSNKDLALHTRKLV
jgi:hypothetical protein